MSDPFELDEAGQLPPGPPVEPAHSGDKRKVRQECPECGKTVGNLPSHLSQVHKIRGANETKTKRDRAPSSAAEKKATSPAELGQAFTFLYQMAGEVWSVQDPFCGSVLKASAPNLGQAWARACEQSPTIQRLAESMMGGGAILGLAMAHLPVMAAVIQHHGPAARRQAEAEQMAAWEAEQAAHAGEPGWVPPGAVPADEAYGAYSPGSADNAR